MVYYPDWVAGYFPPEKVDFGRIDWVDFAFATPKQDLSLGWDGADDAPQILDRLVKAAHQRGKKVKLSVGGWTGSKYFSPAVATAQSRQTFVSNILALYQQHSLDGIDIDWEYPGQAGAGNNVVDKNDSQNFLAFLQLLRSRLPAVARISAAAQTVPFVDQSGKPITDARAFAKVLDWVLMMNYDVWGASSTPGPNAPLSNACHNSTQPDASAEAAIGAWTSAGFPANKLVLGLPAYGYVSRSTATHLRQRDFPPTFFPAMASNSSVQTSSAASSSSAPTTASFSSSSAIATMASSTLAPSPSTSSPSPSQTPFPSNGTGAFPGSNTTFHEAPTKQAVNLTTTDGPQIQFRDLVRQGALCASQGGKGYVGCGGFVRYWDACSSSPWLRSASAGQIVTYDDAESLGLKAGLVKQKGVLGVNVFDVSGDTDQWDLVDAIRKGLGVR
ncbi:glycoside hydrolase superfamily [Amylostereum chailletii]|nr:glycoside hydrolase superfamily [Amylostereum chailletii]